MRGGSKVLLKHQFVGDDANTQILQMSFGDAKDYTFDELDTITINYICPAGSECK